MLLKGVNDTVETLSDLMRAFVEAGVKPYYLHQGDFARGTAHWRTRVEYATDERGRAGLMLSICQVVMEKFRSHLCLVILRLKVGV